jgi:hypothetical protein
LSLKKVEQKNEEKIVVQDDIKFLARIQVTNARHINFKQLISAHFTNQK